MFEKLKLLKENYLKMCEEMLSPDVIADNKRYIKLSKDISDLTELIEKYDEYEKNMDNFNQATELLKVEKDAEMRELANMEIEESKDKLKDIEAELKMLLLPKDENDTKNVIIEIRAGAGGDEACLFANSLTRMYRMYAESHKFKVEILDINETDMKGIKEISFMLKGKNAYATFKYESGVHRVQRVPETESQGRVHTSTVTVAVLPEMENVAFEIDAKDIRMDIYRASGAGGQHVNKTESAIRITHFPTGIVVACQDERSQVQNKEKAMTMLKSKLYDYYESQRDNEYKQNRRSQIGTGDRSERIRTYNYPQGRVSDHRINMTLYSLDSFLNGNIDDMLEALKIADQQAKLANQDN